MDCLTIHKCVECSAVSPMLCVRCGDGHSVNRSLNVCECLRESGYTCGADLVCVAATRCVRPVQCHEQNPHCLHCNAVDPELCDVCADGTAYSADNGLCMCGIHDCTSGQTCSDWVCSGPKQCLQHSNCTHCDSSDLTKCAACAHGFAVDSAGACTCGGKQCADGQACAEGKCVDSDCKTGPTAVKHCLRCATENKLQCAECGDYLHLRGNVCECRYGHGADCGNYSACVYDAYQCFNELECLTRVSNCESCVPEDVRLCKICYMGYSASADGKTCYCGDTATTCEGAFYCQGGQCVYSECRALIPHADICGAANPKLVVSCKNGHTVDAKNASCLCVDVVCSSLEYCSEGVCVASCKTQQDCAECSEIIPERCLECQSEYRIDDYGHCKCNDISEHCGAAATCIDSQCVQNCLSLDENCASCDQYDARRCEVCANDYRLDFASQRCVCGYDASTCYSGQSCVNGQCESDCFAIDHCLQCVASDPFKCAACSDGMKPSYQGTFCACGPLQLRCRLAEYCSGGKCVANCLEDPQCVRCDSNFPQKCVECRGELSIGQDGKCTCGGIVCPEHAFCVANTCKNDCTVLEHCLECEYPDLSRCSACADGYYLTKGRCSSRLSVGSIVGISVGAAIGVVIVVVVVWACYRKRGGGVAHSGPLQDSAHVQEVQNQI